jgi:hypothetical protein
MNKALEKFNQLTYEKYAYPNAPHTKADLLEYVQCAAKAINEDNGEISVFELQGIGLNIQGNINASKLYESSKELQEVNDDFLGYEDYDIVHRDSTPERIEEITKDFKRYIVDLPEYIDKILF